MDAAGALGCLGTGTERPRTGLLLAGREVGAQTEQVVRAADHGGQCAVAEPECLQHLLAVGFVQLRGLGLDLHAHADHLDVGGDPGRAHLRAHALDLDGDPVQFVLADVHHGEHRAVGEQEVRCERLAVVLREVAAVDRRALGEHVVGALHGLGLTGCVLVDARRLGRRLQTLLHGLQVGECELDLDHAQVLERVVGARHVVVLERTQDEDDRVDLADVREELVAETLALARTLDKATDVHDLHARVHRLLGLRHHRQCLQPGIRNLGHADVRLLRGEGIGGRKGTGIGEGVVEGGLARVGQADETEAFHGKGQG